MRWNASKYLVIILFQNKNTMVLIHIFWQHFDSAYFHVLLQNRRTGNVFQEYRYVMIMLKISIMGVDFLFILRATSSTRLSFHFFWMCADNPFTIHSSLFYTVLISAIFASISCRFVYITCWHFLFPTILSATAKISKTTTSRK